MKTTLILAGAVFGLAVLGVAGLLVSRHILDRLTRLRDEAVWWEEMRRRRAIYREGMAVADGRYAAIPGHEARAVTEQVHQLLRQGGKRQGREPRTTGANVRRFPRQTA